MKLFTTLAVATLGFAGMIEAAAISVRNEAAGMTYVGPITPGGPNVTLVGDATDIYNQIVVLNPAFNPDDFEIVQKAKAKRDFNELTKRSHSGCCGCNNIVGEAYVNAADTINSANSLYQLPGACYSSQGTAYNRMACTNHAGAFIASPSGGAEGSSCTVVAQYVLDIVASCATFAGRNYAAVEGQICDSAGYCVIVSQC